MSPFGKDETLNGDITLLIMRMHIVVAWRWDTIVLEPRALCQGCL